MTTPPRRAPFVGVAAAAIALLSLTACPADDGFSLPPDSMKTCTDAADCVLVELDCCDHCNGGTLTAVNRDSEAQARAELRNTSCGQTDCTERACAAKMPTCDNGLCGFIEAVDCSTLDEAACTANPFCNGIAGISATDYCADDLSNWPNVWAGCMDAMGTCGGAITCGRDPADGTTMVFPSTCLPAGWESLGGVSGPPCCP